MQFGIVADDNTGASDAAGMLTERGVKTLLVLDNTALSEKQAVFDYDAVIASTASRSLKPEEAYSKTASAVETIKALGINKFQIKYSSTFDSTKKGNIGPSLDAAMDVLGTQAVTVSPALPVNGRTTYFGYHFVNGVLISESPLKDHPLNPITEPSIVRWLQYQTKRRVGLAPLGIIRSGAVHLRDFLSAERSRGISYFVTDTIEQRDLSVIAEAAIDWPLISGGSGITAEVSSLLFRKRRVLNYAGRLAVIVKKTLIVSGSCTPMTLMQNEYALKAGFMEFKIDGVKVLKGEVDPEEMAETILKRAGKTSTRDTHSGGIIISTSAEKQAVDVVKEFGAGLGYTPEETGLKVSEVLASVCAKVVKRERFGRLIVSGGETSGTVCRYLGIKSLEVGLPVEPGVPYCLTAGKPEMIMVLKSGNFGSKDFYLKVLEL